MFGEIRKNISLKMLSHMKIGGRARYFFTAKEFDDVIWALDYWRNPLKGNLKDVLVVGETTNILFPDSGFKGLIIKNKISFIERLSGNILFAGAGTSMAAILKYCLSHKLSGLEWSSGLPGTLGGAIRGNAGAFGGEIKDSAYGIISLDINKNNIELRMRRKEECEFGYRKSVFKKNEANNPKKIILGAYLKLEPMKSYKQSKKRIGDILNYRLLRHPMEFPTLGSTFKNVYVNEIPARVKKLFGNKVKDDPVPILPAAVLLSSSGICGFAIGGAKFSEKHCNFIVNYKNASSKDVKKLISAARQRVWEKFHVKLEEEIEIVN